MNINEQLEHFLADLGVEMEQPGNVYRDENSIPEVSIFQSSRDHYGVFYRLDIIEHIPQLRIMVPIDSGAAKMEMYLVCMSEQLPLNPVFTALASYQGSTAFEHTRDAVLQHLLYAVAEVMKQLFWSGDQNSMCFPPEIEVCRIL